MDFQLVILRGRSASTVLKLGDGVTTAGRHDDCQLRIKSSEVSRKHCQFFEKNGMLLVKDLGSSNGTYLNGKKIEGQRVLEPGDELGVGPVKLRVESVGKPGPTRAAAKPGDTAVPAPVASTEARSDEFSIDFDDEESASEEKTIAAKPSAARPGGGAGAGAAAAAAGAGAAAAAAASAAVGATPAAADEIPLSSEAGMEDDAIADFLLDLKLDDE